MKRRLNQLLCVVLGVVLGFTILLPVTPAKAEPPVDEAPVDTSTGAAADTPEPVDPNARPTKTTTDKHQLSTAPNPAALQLPTPTTDKQVQVASAPTPSGVSVAGAVWEGSSDGVSTYLRTVTAGRTTAWQPIDTEDSTEGLNGTAAVTLINADSVQIATVSDRTLNVSLSVVDPRTSMTSAASIPQPTKPTIRTRADWGADESLVRTSPTYASVNGVVVHHTEGSNSYSAAQVPAIIRGIYAYHVRTRGWNDIGYNVLVDKFGVAWEGRRGGLERAVQGAHATNFNHVSFGISLMGSYLTAIPSSAALETISRVIAWKFSIHGVRAYGSYTNYGRTYPAIVGHMDVQATDCPGTYLYSQLGNIKSRVASLLSQYDSGAPAPQQPVDVTATTSGTRDVDQLSYVWGSAANAAGSRVALEALVNGNWSLSQVGTVAADGSYSLPLTYGATTAGTYRFRVAVTVDAGTGYSPEFTFTRTAVVTATSAGTKPIGQGANAWGTARGGAGAQVAVQVLLNGRWSTSQTGTVKSDGSYVLPLSHGSGTLGTYRFRVAVSRGGGTGFSPEFSFTRTAPVVPNLVVSAATAGTKPVGQATNVWGTARGAAGAEALVQVLVNGRWSTSQISVVKSDGTYVLPLTYGRTTVGTTYYRVGVTTASGVVYSSRVGLTRTALNIQVTAATAGTKPVGQATNVWGTARGAEGAQALVQVLVNGQWSTSQIGVVKSDGSYVLPLTYGRTTRGTAYYRVGVTTVTGVVFSQQVGLTRV